MLTIEEADEEMLGFFEAEESPGEGVFDDEVRSSSVLLPAQDQVIANLEFAGIHLKLTSSLLGTKYQVTLKIVKATGCPVASQTEEEVVLVGRKGNQTTTSASSVRGGGGLVKRLRATWAKWLLAYALEHHYTLTRGICVTGCVQIKMIGGAMADGSGVISTPSRKHSHGYYLGRDPLLQLLDLQLDLLPVHFSPTSLRGLPCFSSEALHISNCTFLLS